MTPRTTIIGWPIDSGPLKSLAAARLIPEGSDSVPWAFRFSTRTSDDRISYRANSKHLSHHALRALASLTLDSWSVRVTPVGELLSIVITSPRTI